MQHTVVFIEEKEHLVQNMCKYICASSRMQHADSISALQWPKLRGQIVHLEGLAITHFHSLAKFQSGKAILLQNLEAKWSFKLCLTYCSLTIMMMMKMIIMIIQMIMMIRMMILRQNYHLSNNPRDHPTKPYFPSTTETNVYR